MTVPTGPDRLAERARWLELVLGVNQWSKGGG